MSIDIAKARNLQLPELSSEYSRDQVILYHLGVGAGVPPTEPSELEYTFERDLKVLPSFATIPGGVGFLFEGVIPGAPGFDFDRHLRLHGEHEIILHQPLPPEARVRTKTHVADIYDKGSGAVVVLESESVDGSGAPLFTNRAFVFAQEQGGFGGDRGPKAGNQPPARDPDGVVETATLEQQALLYRLSGDMNPLHADPGLAGETEYQRPMTHGLCNFGIGCKAVVDHALDGDVTRVASYRVRFAGTAYPGETFVTSFWKEPGRILLQVESRERGVIILSNAAITLRQ